MAGESKLMREVPLRAGKEEINNDTDVIQFIFSSTPYGSIDVNNATVDSSIFTPVSGGQVAANYPLTTTWSRTANEVQLTALDVGTITQDAANPTTIQSAVCYNATADIVYTVYDMSGLDFVNTNVNINFVDTIYKATI